MNIKALPRFWKSFTESNLGKKLVKLFRGIAVVAIFAFLVYQLNKIGWVAILKSLPTTPWFYLLFIIGYFALPISEQFIYRLSLPFTFWEGFKVFIIKKILNSDLIAYSGEAYLFAYGKKNWQVDAKYLFNVVKDNNIISSFVSTSTAIILLSLMTYYGQVNFLDFIIIPTSTMIGIAAVVMLIIILLIVYRKKIISFDTSTAIKIYVTHQVRLITVYSVEILQCIVALPLIPLDIWFTFLAIKIIYTRIPFLPSQDILLLGVYAKVSELYNVPQAEIMAIYLMIVALSKILNAVLYPIFSLGKKPNSHSKILTPK